MRTFDHMLNEICNPDTPARCAAIIGMNSWHRGLKIQQHRLRVEREEAESAARYNKSMVKALKRKVMKKKRHYKRKKKCAE